MITDVHVYLDEGQIIVGQVLHIKFNDGMYQLVAELIIFWGYFNFLIIT